MIGSRRTVFTSIHATGRRRLAGMPPWVAVIGALLLGCAATDSAESKSEPSSVIPMVLLQQGFTDHQVTGKINTNEWWKEQEERLGKPITCWQAYLLNFRVFHTDINPSYKCTKKGIEILKGANPKVVIVDANCSAKQEHPHVRVRICQHSQPGILDFNFKKNLPSKEGGSFAIRANHFSVGGQLATSLRANLKSEEEKHESTFTLMIP